MQCTRCNLLAFDQVASQNNSQNRYDSEHPEHRDRLSKHSKLLPNFEIEGPSKYSQYMLYLEEEEG